MEKVHKLIQILRDRKLTVSFAESCTGGQLSAFITEQPGVSDIFIGSVVSYSNESKIELLGVSRETLIDEGAVSETVARQMAQGAQKKLKSEFSVAITGIAGPTGGSELKPVGTVCFAVSGTNLVMSKTARFSGNRKEIQVQACEFAMQFLTETIKQQFPK